MPYKDKERQKAYQKAYYEARKEQLRARHLEWARVHKDKMAEYKSRYDARNKAEKGLSKLSSRSESQ